MVSLVWKGHAVNAELAVLIVLMAVSIGVGGLILWATLVYEPRQREKNRHMSRLFECSMAKILLNDENTATQKVILREINKRRPGIESWDEWSTVWGGQPPVH